MVSARGEYPLLQTLFDHLVHHLVHQLLKLPEWSKWSKILTRASQKPTILAFEHQNNGLLGYYGYLGGPSRSNHDNSCLDPACNDTRALVLGFKGPLQDFCRDRLENIASCLESLIPII